MVANVILVLFVTLSCIVSVSKSSVSKFNAVSVLSVMDCPEDCLILQDISDAKLFVQLVFPAPSVVSTYPLVPAEVGSFIVHVPAASATESVTVPLVVPFRSIAPVVPPAVPTVTVEESVGAVSNTSFPLPVSSVIADARLALEGVAKNVGIHVPSHDTHVEIGSPVQFVRVQEAGVPSTGATNVLLVKISVHASVAIVPS